MDGNAIITNYTGTATNVVFPSTIDGHPVTEIAANAFYYGTYPFVNVTISEGIKKIGHAAFGYSTKMETFSIPSTLATFGDGEGFEFIACGKMRRIDVAEGNANYKSVDGALYDKAGTTLIYCPASMDPGGSFVVPQEVTRIAEYAFCSSKFKSVALPEGLSEIEDNVFWAASGIETVSIPITVTSIGRWAFCYCYSLTSLQLPLHLTSIGQYALVGSELTELDIPSGVTTIGQGALNDCGSLTNLTLRGRVATTYAANKWGSNLSNSKVWVASADFDYWSKVWGNDISVLGSGIGAVTPIEISGGETGYEVSLPGRAETFVVDGAWLTSSGIDVSGGVTSGLLSANGANGLPRYQSYLFGLEPESTVPAEKQLKTTISFDADGKLVVSCEPKRESSLVTYTTLGKETLTDVAWREVTDNNRADMKFFKVRVDIK